MVTTATTDAAVEDMRGRDGMEATLAPVPPLPPASVTELGAAASQDATATVALLVGTAPFRFPGRRVGRGRAARCEITWHATDEAGLRVRRSGRSWIAERDRTVAGLPGEPVVVATGPTAVAIGLDPTPLALGRFIGTRRCSTVLGDDNQGAPVRLELLQGGFRGVEGDRPAGWLSITGPSRAVAAFAGRLDVDGTGALATGSLAAAALGETPPPPPPPELDPALSLDDALALVFGTLGATLLHWAPRAVGGEADAVHAMRVASRRARSALVVFRAGLGTGPGGGFRGDTPNWRDGLRALAETLGQARDWDVFLDDTAPAVAGSLPDGTTIDGLLGEARGARARAYRALGEALGAAPARGLMATLALAPHARPWRQPSPPPAGADGAAHAAAEQVRLALLSEPVGALASRLLDRRWRRLMRGRHALDGLDDAALHDARKAAKKLRYTLEFLRPAFPYGDARRLIRRLGRVQDALGTLNDGATGAALIRALPRNGRRHGREAGIVIGWLAARALGSREAADERWAAIRRQERFWR